MRVSYKITEAETNDFTAHVSKTRTHILHTEKPRSAINESISQLEAFFFTVFADLNLLIGACFDLFRLWDNQRKQNVVADFVSSRVRNDDTK